MKNYPFAMSVLYQTIRIVLMNCLVNMAKFTGFKSKYNDAFVSALMAELEAAEKMKGEQARSLEHESLRQEMLPLGETCRELWQFLKRYIADAFGPSMERMNWEAAGWGYYDESTTNWDKLRDMCNMASTYINDNSAKLLLEGFMPVTFEQDFNNARDAFNSKYDAFILAEENARQGTADKITGNNTIYDKTVSVCLDGQVLFMNDEVKKKLFSMEAVSELVQPTGAAGMKGTVTKDGEPQAGITVELENKNLSVITDAEGAFDFGNKLASGDDKLLIKKGDEILKEEDVVIPPGVTVREDIELPSTPPVA